MLSSEEVQRKLDKLKKRKKRFELTGKIAAMLATIPVIVGVGDYTYQETGSLLGTGIFSLALGGIGFLLLVSVGLASEEFFKEYFFEDCEDVLKVHGTVSHALKDEVYKELLSVRPGYKIAKNAWETFGCTLAAIPATQGWPVCQLLCGQIRIVKWIFHQSSVK